MKDPGFSFLLSTPAICLHFFFQDANSTHWLHQPSVALVIPTAMLRKWHLHKRSNICHVINYISFAQNFQTMLYKVGLPNLHRPVCGTHNEWTRCTETLGWFPGGDVLLKVFQVCLLCCISRPPTFFEDFIVYGKGFIQTKKKKWGEENYSIFRDVCEPKEKF